MNRAARAGLLFALASGLLLGGCSSPPDYAYQYVPGRTAVVRDGIAYAPPAAPPAVKAAVAAGNRIAGSPYRYGGGHGLAAVESYDCSGAVSYVLRTAGLAASRRSGRLVMYRLTELGGQLLRLSSDPQAALTPRG